MFPTNLQVVVNPDHSVTANWQDSDVSQDTNEGIQIWKQQGTLINELLPAGTLAFTTSPLPHGKYKCYAKSFFPAGYAQTDTVEFSISGN
jgi:hypothetical protein